jgi:hypothetical protein
MYYIQLLLACVREETYLITTSSKVAWPFRCGYDATEYDETMLTEEIHVKGEPFPYSLCRMIDRYTTVIAIIIPEIIHLPVLCLKHNFCNIALCSDGTYSVGPYRYV